MREAFCRRHEQAYASGIAVAAFRLGALFEQGVQQPPDAARALTWYQKAANSAEPNALARLAERASEAAFSETDPARKNGHPLDRSGTTSRPRSGLASRIDRTRPSEIGYQRASLARVLAGEGMMGEIADAYNDIRKQYAPRRTIRDRLTSFVTLD